MHPQTDILLHRFRFLLAGLFITAFLIVISALVTTIGSNTILAGKATSSSDTVGISMSDSPNAVTTSLSALAGGFTHITVSTATTMYNMCRSITAVSAQAGKSTMHGSTVIIHGTGSSIIFAVHGVASGISIVFRGIGSGILFTLRIPHRIIGSLSDGHAVSAIIRPSDNKQLPVINGETSAAVLAQLNAQQRQYIANLLTAQAAANRNLGGSILSGDPHHGGYPANWDNTPQDSTLDSWGMYNRECVSYTAWKVYQTYGHMPYWGGVGNANQWVRDAQNAGVPTSSVPQIHSVAISMSGYYGHAMWVEKVQGTMIYVSQYNYDLHGHYSEMWVNSSRFTYIYFK